MTKSDSYFYRLAMPRPFAKGSSGTITAIESSSGNNVNFLDGFPSAYSAPSSGGGKYITRGEMNAIGNLASQNQFYFLAGGINTFDSTFATSIGGYPKDAVLKYLNNGYLYDVVSLVDNNTVDFTSVGVDGENWGYLSVTEKKVFDDVFFEGGTGITVGSGVLAIIKAKKSAGLVVQTALSPTTGDIETEYSASGITETRAGCGIMIKDCGTTLPSSAITFPSATSSGSGFVANWQDWKSLYGDFTIIMKSTSGTGTYYDEQYEAGAMMSVTKDRYYAIGLMCGEGVWAYAESASVIKITKFSSVSGTLRIDYAP